VLRRVWERHFARDGTLPAKVASQLGFDVIHGLFGSGDEPAGLRCVVLRLAVRNGVGTADPFLIDTTASQAIGHGTITFPSQYHLPSFSTSNRSALPGTGGAFTYTSTPTALTYYSVKWKSASSQAVVVQVRPKLTLNRMSATRLFAKITASHPFEGRSILLQRRSSFGQWVTVEKLKLGPLSGRIFKAPHKKGTFTYRVYMTTNQAGSGYLDTWSNSVRVRYRH